MAAAARCRRCCRALLCAQRVSAQDPTAGFTAVDLARGKQVFVGHCAPCHGIDGAGGRGANLTVPKLKRAADNAAFFVWCSTASKALRWTAPGS